VRISGTTLYLITRNLDTQSVSPTVFEFHVGAADLTGVSLSGSGSMRSDGILRAESFQASVSGSGDVRLELDIASELTATVSGSGDLVFSGAANHVNVTVSGSGTADLRAMPAQSAEALVSGSGEAYVYASDSLNARVSGSGDVFYYGAPQSVTRAVTGSGRITDRG